MKIRNILAGTAIATLALFTGLGTPPGTPMVPRAEAAVSVSFSIFYDELEPHGDWVRHRGAYVFIPANVGSDWRPYTRGRWVHTARHGWTWISNEPFGWATYHYGRWGYDREIGWYWRPGYRWAPAWVSWRRGTDYIVWAPLPPSDRDDDVDVSISITVGDIPDFYWVAVPARRFLSADIHVVVVNEEPEIRRVIERTEFVGAPRVTNNIVVNNFIDVDVVAEITGQEVKTVEVRETDDPRQASASGDELTVFRAEVEREEDARPKEVKDVSEVKKVKRSGEEGEAAGTEPIPEPDAASETTAAPEGEAEQPAAGATPEQPPAETAGESESETGSQQEQAEEQSPAQGQPAQEQAEEQPPAQGQPAQEQAEEQPPAQGQPAQEQAEEQPPAQGQPAQEQAEEQPPAQGQPEQRQAEEQPEAPAEEATGSTAPPQPQEEEPQSQGNASGDNQNRGQQKRECDPGTDPDCEAAQ
jgi:hypothetical protein